MEIGNKIAKVRKEMNLTQEQLAERMQVTRQTVSRWESQTVYPEMEKIVMLSEILGVAVTIFCMIIWRQMPGAAAEKLCRSLW